MAVPKRRTSKSRQGNRRAHHAIGKPGLRPCPNCGAYGIPHRVCTTCGTYKGRVIVAPKMKKVADDKKKEG